MSAVIEVACPRHEGRKLPTQHLYYSAPVDRMVVRRRLAGNGFPDGGQLVLGLVRHALRHFDVKGNGQQPPALVELVGPPIVGGIFGRPVTWLVKPAAHQLDGHSPTA